MMNPFYSVQRCAHLCWACAHTCVQSTLAVTHGERPLPCVATDAQVHKSGCVARSLTLCHWGFVTQLFPLSLAFDAALTLVFLALRLLLLVQFAAPHLVAHLTGAHAQAVVRRLRQCHMEPTFITVGSSSSCDAKCARCVCALCVRELTGFGCACGQLGARPDERDVACHA
jgi:hypothetical protein